MFFYISKFIEFVVDPYIWFFIIAILAYRKMNKGKAKRLFLGALVLLYLFSNKFLFSEMSMAWEPDGKHKKELKPEYEVAIVLGGVAGIDKAHMQLHFYENAERIFNVLPLYFEGRVKKILLSGGSGRLFSREEEATILQDYLLQIGVKKEDLIIENKSRNTFENALFSTQKLKEEQISGPILLSTSATHMKRSYLCFKKQGLEVEPFPVDHVIEERIFHFDTLFLPKSSILNKWYWLLHEWVGIVVYSLMGYC